MQYPYHDVINASGYRLSACYNPTTLNTLGYTFIYGLLCKHNARISYTYFRPAVIYLPIQGKSIRTTTDHNAKNIKIRINRSTRNSGNPVNIGPITKESCTSFGRYESRRTGSGIGNTYFGNRVKGYRNTKGKGSRTNVYPGYFDCTPDCAVPTGG
jgi:hypothetical protein